MCEQNTLFVNFIVALHNTSSLDEAFAVYDRQVQQLGFEGALYAFIPRLYLETDSSFLPVSKISESRNPAFLQHYQEAGFEKHDFSLRSIMQGRMDPIDWWGEECKGILTPVERQVLVTAREDYGIMHGVSLCTMNEERGVAGASIVSSEKTPQYRKLVDERLQAWQLSTELFHAHVMVDPHLHTFFLSTLLERLTVKEKQLLRFIVEGKPMKSADIPNLTYKYNDKLLHGIRRKLGGLSKGRLIYHLGLLHILDHI